MQPKGIARFALQLSLALSLLTVGTLMSLALAGELQPELKGTPRFVGFPDPLRGHFRELEGIDLTTQQEEELLKIREEMRLQFESILPHPQLTPEQQSQWEACQSLQQTLPPPPPLTTQQRNQMQQVMQTYFQKIEAVLTTSQREQFRQNQERMRLFKRHPESQ